MRFLNTAGDLKGRIYYDVGILKLEASWESGQDVYVEVEDAGGFSCGYRFAGEEFLPESSQKLGNSSYYWNYIHGKYWRSEGSGGNIWFDNAEHMDIPRKSSAPTAYGGRVYMNTTDNVCYIYDDSRAAWRDLGL